MNTTMIIQLITGALGSTAFGILFHMKSKHLPLAAAGGILKLAGIYFRKSDFGEMFFCLHCWLVLLQMCMPKSLQEYVKELLPPFLLPP